MLSVHIKLSDKGWILEQCAQRLAERLDYVTYGLESNPSATIQYYMTYGSREDRVSKLEVAFITHLEEQVDAQEQFYKIAGSVDLNICMSRRYHSLLETKGYTNSVVIKPGVDLASFTPKLRIGVVGRTYHTGRKGEHIVAEVLDIPEIDWYFTGSGWPRPALDLAPTELPDFYRNMDYILIPSLYEGGPMSAVEALACGTPVIATDVGWMADYPHISFSADDSGDLRRVLNDLVAAKMTLRKHVANQTWDRFAEEHDATFRKLITDKFPGEIVTPARARAKPGSRHQTLGRISLILQKAEGQLAGGPSMRVPELAKTLCEQGIDARLAAPDEIQRSEIAHVFNVWEPTEAIAALRSLRLRGARILFSPIFIDLSARHLWDQKLISLFETATGSALPDAALQSFKDEYAAFCRIPFSERPEPFSGYHDQVRTMLALADHIAFLSEDEKSKLSVIARKPVIGSFVRNAAAPLTTDKATPSSFRNAFPSVPKQFVLSVGRIETRKNQLMLAIAARKRELPLVLVGDIVDENYANLIKKFGGADVTLLGRLSAESGLLQSAIAAASVVALPSWAEGTPLSALEALAAGKRIVLSNQPNLREHFGDTVDYCEPHDADDIGEKIFSAFQKFQSSPENPPRGVTTIPRWSDHVRDTLQAYEDCISKPRNMTGRFPVDAAVMDSLLLDERIRREAAELRTWHIDQHAGALAGRLEERTTVVADLEREISRLEREISRLEREISRLSDVHAETLASYYWRMTAPLRKLTATLLRLRDLFR